MLHGDILFNFTELFSVQSLLAHLMRTAYVMTGIHTFLTYSHSLSAFSFCRMFQKITEMSLFIQGGIISGLVLQISVIYTDGADIDM